MATNSHAQVLGDPPDVSQDFQKMENLRFSTRAVPLNDGQSLMLAGPVPKDASWRVEQNDKEIIYTGAHGRVKIIRQPSHVEIYDARGRLLTRTQNIGDPATFITPIPFSFVRRASDLSRRIAATFEVQHDEKIFERHSLGIHSVDWP